ncbi:geranylgeranyl transferase type-1 subunit beta [Marasmius crinis-equi]|uniref:Geranylgeranyl transferase type-1 subunit beta n=1 Tax=Marasmius crinis-equi TaxID=585013 RepID=A0ABR3F5S5_9AGAR
MAESDSMDFQLEPLRRPGHAGHVKRCLVGLPSSQTDNDGARLALAFYCIGSLDLLGVINEKVPPDERDSWRSWIWEQQTRGRYGTGFRPSPFMTSGAILDQTQEYGQYDTPHLIMTYTALLSLAILRDDFSALDRQGLVKFLKACQTEDGSFTTVPKSGDTDLRTLYCAFAISSMLNDWSGIDVERALSFVASCRTYEGGYGGPTYIALAAIYLAPAGSKRLTPAERQKSVQWLVNNQASSGGFRGRTNKEADACYCFWCGAALKILGAEGLVDSLALAKFISECQFRYGGIGKAPGENPDPYHTYLSLAALSIYPPPLDQNSTAKTSWEFEKLDPLLNAREGTVKWLREHIAKPGSR